MIGLTILLGLFAGVLLLCGFMLGVFWEDRDP